MAFYRLQTVTNTIAGAPRGGTKDAPVAGRYREPRPETPGDLQQWIGVGHGLIAMPGSASPGYLARQASIICILTVLAVAYPSLGSHAIRLSCITTQVGLAFVRNPTLNLER